MQDDHPAGLDHPQIGPHRLHGQHVDGHAVGGEGVDQQHVEALARLLGQRQARVAKHMLDPALGAAVDVAEPRRIGGQAHHQRVDLVEAHDVGGPHIGGDHPRAHADRADVKGGLGGLLGAQHLPDRTGGRVVEQRGAFERRVIGLGAVHGRAVLHEPDRAELGHVEAAQLHHPEEAPLGDRDVHAIGGDRRGDGQGGQQRHMRRGAVAQHEGGQHRHPEQRDLHRPRQGEMRIGDEGGAGDPGQQQQELGPVQRSPPPRPREPGQNEDDGILPHIVEDRGRQEGVEGAADDPAQRHQEVELGQAADRRAMLHQGLVTDQRGQEEGGEVQRQQRQPRHGAHGKQQQADRHDRPLQQQRDARRDRRLGLEGHHEGQQVEHQRPHPQERRGGHVGGDVGGDPQQQG